jgi:cytochrome c-type biogenesis protein CcsB
MSELQLAMTNTAGVSTLMSFWVFVASNAVNRWREAMFKLAQLVMVIGFIALTIAIVTRGIDAQRFPLANLYEAILWFAWAIMGGYLLLARAYGINHLGWLASLTAASMFLYGSWLPANQHEITPLVPALVSYWRQIHVPPLIVSYSLFFLSGLSGLVQLWYSGHKRTAFAAVLTILAATVLPIALGTYTSVDTGFLQAAFVGGNVLGALLCFANLKFVAQGSLEAKAAATYDDVSYRCVAIGFPLLTIGVITGGLWANHAWGTYWSWDPKESMALVTWLLYAAYIHLRVYREIAAEKLSVVAIIGLSLTLLTFLGFNALGFGGLHSYGRFK